MDMQPSARQRELLTLVGELARQAEHSLEKEQSNGRKNYL